MRHECTIKETTIELLEIAEVNLLISFYGLEPDQITKPSKPEVNPIAWIYGHCISHMDFIYGELCQGSRLLPKEVGKLVSYGATKESVAKGLPISFKELVEYGLKITERTYKYLQNLPEENFHDLPEKDAEKKTNESVVKSTQRVALHIMGHMGQIIMIRRILGDKGGGFVGGMVAENRVSMKEKWTEWWEENKEKFQ
ncbi:MAG: DinB family protein [Candidatus Heimdallarchaeota archaeon]